MLYSCVRSPNINVHVLIILVSIYVMSAAPGERDAVFLRHIIGIEWPDQKKVSICYMCAHICPLIHVHVFMLTY